MAELEGELTLDIQGALDSVEDVGRALDAATQDISVGADTSDAIDSLDQLSSTIESLSGEVAVGLDPAEALSELDGLSTTIDSLSGDVAVGLDTGAAAAELDGLTATIDALTTSETVTLLGDASDVVESIDDLELDQTVTVRADVTSAENSIGALDDSPIVLDADIDAILPSLGALVVPTIGLDLGLDDPVQVQVELEPTLAQVAEDAQVIGDAIQETGTTAVDVVGDRFDELFSNLEPEVNFQTNLDAIEAELQASAGVFSDKPVPMLFAPEFDQGSSRDFANQFGSEFSNFGQDLTDNIGGALGGIDLTAFEQALRDAVAEINGSIAFGDAFDSAAAQLSERFGPSIEEIGALLRTAFDQPGLTAVIEDDLLHLDAAVQEFVDSVDQAMRDFASDGLDVSEFDSNLSSIGDAFASTVNQLREDLTDVFSNVDAGPITDELNHAFNDALLNAEEEVAQLIGGVNDVAEALESGSNEFARQIELAGQELRDLGSLPDIVPLDSFDGLDTAVQEFSDQVDGLTETLGDDLDSVFDGMDPTGAVQTFEDAFSQAVDNARTELGDVFGSGSAPFGDVTSVFDTLVAQTEAAMESALRDIQDFVPSVSNIDATEAVNELHAQVQDAVGDAVRSISELQVDITPQIDSAAVQESVEAPMSAAATAFQEQINEALSGLVNGDLTIGGLAASLSDAITEMRSAIAAAFGDVPEVDTIPDAFLNAMLDAVVTARLAIADLSDTGVEITPDINLDAAVSLADAVRDASDEAQASMTHLADNLSEGFSTSADVARDELTGALATAGAEGGAALSEAVSSGGILEVSQVVTDMLGAAFAEAGAAAAEELGVDARVATEEFIQIFQDAIDHLNLERDEPIVIPLEVDDAQINDAFDVIRGNVDDFGATFEDTISASIETVASLLNTEFGAAFSDVVPLLGDSFDEVIQNTQDDIADMLDEGSQRGATFIETNLADAARSSAADFELELEAINPSFTPFEIPLDPDTEGALTEISTGLESLHPVVPVEADTDTESVVNEIEALHPDPVVVPVEADLGDFEEALSQAGGGGDVPGELDAISAAADGAGGSLGGAAEQAGLAGAAFSGIGASTGVVLGTLAGLGVGFHSMIDEAIDATGAVQRFQSSLGDMADDVEHLRGIDGLNTNLSKLALTLGSDDDEVRQVAARLFELSTASGIARTEASQFVQQMIALGARSVAINPQLGDLGTVTDSLSTALVRGGRFAAKFNLDLNQADINARALSDTHKETADQLTFVEKAMAGAAIASEKYGSSLERHIATGSQNAITIQRRLGQTIRETLEEFGKPLVFKFFDVLEASQPLIAALASVLSDLALGALPTATIALQALAVPLELVHDLLEIIPQPLLAAAATFLVFSKAMSFATLTANKLGAGALTGSIAGGISKLAPLTDGLGTKVQGLGEKFGGVLKTGMANIVPIAAGAALAFDALSNSTAGSADSVLKLVASGAAIGSTFGPEGAAIGAFTGLVVAAGAALFDAGEAVDDYRERIGKLGSELEKLSRGKALEKFTSSLGETDLLGLATGNVRAITDEITALGSQSPAAARKVVRALKDMRDESGKPLFTGRELDILERALDKGIDKFQAFTRRQKNATDANKDLADSATGASGAIETQAKVLDDATLSAIAFVNHVVAMNKATDELATQFSSGLPGVGDAFSAAAEGAKAAGREFVGAFDFASALSAQVESTQVFTDNLKVLIDNGFGLLAAQVAEKGPKAGGQIAQEIADGLRNGDRSVAEGMQALVVTVLAQTLVMRDAVAQVFGPGIAIDAESALGVQREAIARQLGLTYITLKDGTQRIIPLTALAFFESLKVAERAQANLVASIGDTGDALAIALGEHLDGVPAAAQAATDGAGKAIEQSDAPEKAAAGGKQIGSQFAQGVVDALGSSDAAVQSAAALLVPTGGVGAHDNGVEIGARFGQGVVEGVAAGEVPIQSAAAAVIPTGGIGAAEHGHTIGERFGTELAHGILDRENAIRQAGQEVIPTGGLGAEDAGFVIGVRFGNALAEGISTTAGAVRDATVGIIPTGGLGAEDSGFVIGQRFDNGIADGMGNNISVVIAAAKAVIRAAVDAANNAGSPSTHLFRDLGAELTAALASGFDDTADAERAARRMVRNVVDEAAAVGAVTPLTVPVVFEVPELPVMTIRAAIEVPELPELVLRSRAEASAAAGAAAAPRSLSIGELHLHLDGSKVTNPQTAKRLGELQAVSAARKVKELVRDL